MKSIIIKTALAATKGSQTPAEASAEVILDKLEEVRNDAKTQHSSSATEVTKFQVTSETATQSITEARITSVRLISFVNEGDSVRSRWRFAYGPSRGATPAEEQAKKAPRLPPGRETEKPVAPAPSGVKQAAIRPPPAPAVPPFKRSYRRWR
jgi:hypothetical protein